MCGRSDGGAAGAQQLPGRVVRREGAKSLGDIAVDEANAGLGATSDFYLANYRRNSIDDAGFPLKATAYYGVGGYAPGPIHVVG